ncbi:hypothetical protein WN944_008330 [Citrus x changshan-huyou]|uniref:Uncharacterized protein n=1 Tax=Citrus x changshan-huyou TaxID=2935761 RepID=A0AAP0MSC7_9ROSI
MLHAKNIVVHITIICSIQEAEILRCSNALDACGRHENEDQTMAWTLALVWGDGEGERGSICPQFALCMRRRLPIKLQIFALCMRRRLQIFQNICVMHAKKTAD